MTRASERAKLSIFPASFFHPYLLSVPRCILRLTFYCFPLRSIVAAWLIENFFLFLLEIIFNRVVRWPNSKVTIVRPVQRVMGAFVHHRNTYAFLFFFFPFLLYFEMFYIARGPCTAQLRRKFTNLFRIRKRARCFAFYVNFIAFSIKSGAVFYFPQWDLLSM